MNSAKVAAAEAALNHIIPGTILGVGTGSTVNCLIDAMAAASIQIEGAVASSIATAQRLEAAGFDVLDLNHTGDLDLYIDGADEANPALQLIKGGGVSCTC